MYSQQDLWSASSAPASPAPQCSTTEQPDCSAQPQQWSDPSAAGATRHQKRVSTRGERKREGSTPKLRRMLSRPPLLGPPELDPLAIDPLEPKTPGPTSSKPKIFEPKPPQNKRDRDSEEVLYGAISAMATPPDSEDEEADDRLGFLASIVGFLGVSRAFRRRMEAQIEKILNSPPKKNGEKGSELTKSETDTCSATTTV